MLQGNHEAYAIDEFYPADFWEGLNKEEFEKYTKQCEALPLAFEVGPILALHAAPPDISDLEKINTIENGDEHWKVMTWGDLNENQNPYKEIEYGLRKEFTETYFRRVMEQLGKRILIRGHQPNCPEKMFTNQCLTLFTSCAYERKRTIAIANFDKRIRTLDDLIIEEI